MAKFVTLPQHWNKKPVTVNVDKVLLIEQSSGFGAGTCIVFDKDFSVEVSMQIDEVIALFNSKE